MDYLFKILNIFLLIAFYDLKHHNNHYKLDSFINSEGFELSPYSRITSLKHIRNRFKDLDFNEFDNDWWCPNRNWIKKYINRHGKKKCSLKYGRKCCQKTSDSFLLSLTGGIINYHKFLIKNEN